MGWLRQYSTDTRQYVKKKEAVLLQNDVGLLFKMYKEGSASAEPSLYMISDSRLITAEVLVAESAAVAAASTGPVEPGL
jgi:hypothetical protein